MKVNFLLHHRQTNLSMSMGTSATIRSSNPEEGFSS
jgi:hypothetical protein